MWRAAHLVMLGLGLCAACSGGDDAPAGPIDGAGAPDAADPDAAPPPEGLVIEIGGIGDGTVIAIESLAIFGRCPFGTCVIQNSAGKTLELRAYPLPGATFTGWGGGGCSGTAPCTVQVPASGALIVPASFGVAPGVSLVRASPTGDTLPRAAVRVADGVLVADRHDVVRFRDDGVRVEVAAVDDITLSGMVAVPSGAFFVLGNKPIVLETGGETVLRAFGAGGQVSWSVEPGGVVGGPLEVDAAGNVYLGGHDGSPYVVSYSAAGAERWRRRPAVDMIVSIAVRGGRVAVGGRLAQNGWIGTHDLDGSPGWTHLIIPQVPFSELVMGEVAIDSDGDVIYGARAGGAGHEVGVIDAAGAAEQWRDVQRGKYGQIAVRDDDSIDVWVEFDPGDDSHLFHYAETGGPPAGDTLVADIAEAMAMAATGDGTVYLVSRSESSPEPYHQAMVQRRP